MTITLAPVQPWMNAGIHGQHGPTRLYHVTMQQNMQYNIVVDARGFTPWVQVFFEGEVNPAVSRREDPLVSRCFVHFQPNRTGSYLIQIAANERVVGDFDVTFAQVTQAGPERIRLVGQQTSTTQGELRPEDRIDPAAPAHCGPYREYVVNLGAGMEYKVNVVNVAFQPMEGFQPELRVYGPRGNRIDPDRDIYRTATAGEYRIRVSSANKGMGGYLLQVTHRGALKSLQTIIAVLNEDAGYEDVRSFTGQDPDTPERGPYKAYLVALAKGQTYRVEMSSKNMPSALTLFDLTGKQVMAEAGAPIVYQAPLTGTYCIHAAAGRPGDRGTYSLKISLVR